MSARYHAPGILAPKYSYLAPLPSPCRHRLFCNLSPSLSFAFVSSEAVALCFHFRALAQSRLDSSISKLHRMRTKRLRPLYVSTWPWPGKTAVWGSGDRTRRQKPRPCKCDEYIYTYKRKPNAIHDYLPRAKALGN